MQSCCGCFRSHSIQKIKKERQKRDGGLPIRVMNNSEGYKKSEQQEIQEQDQTQKAQNKLQQEQVQDFSRQNISKQVQFTMPNQGIDTKESLGSRNPLYSQLITNSNVNIKKAESNLDYYFNQSSAKSFQETNVKCSQDMTITPQIASNIYATKLYKFLCHNCHRSFNKVLVTDLNINPNKSLTAFDVQELFSIPQNNQCECPFCHQNCSLLMSSSLILSHQEQLEQQDIVNDLIETEEECHQQTQSLTPQFRLNIGSASEPIQQVIEQDGESSRYSISKYKQTPKVLLKKFQKLKDGNKLAQVYILTDIPNLKLQQRTMLGTTTKCTQVESDEQNSQRYLPSIDLSQKLSFPILEFVHKSDQIQAQQYNKDLMRTLLSKKMQKNKSFHELKNQFNRPVLGTDQRIPSQFARHGAGIYHQKLL